MISVLRLAAALLVVGTVAARGAQVPRTFGLRAEVLVAARNRSVEGDPRLADPVTQLRAEADALLKLKPASVMDKNRVAASGDKHDYFSLATYWWPDPTKPDGRPYIRHDGEKNPEIKLGTDHEAFVRTCNSVETLGLAYWFTGDERYAQKSATLLRVWFLDPATRMNPNLQYAQAITGINDGRGIGIIDSHSIVALIDGLALIATSSAWPANDSVALHTWMSDFYVWLTTSKNGLDEAAAENNHGSWWDVQAVDLALALGRTDDAKKILAAVPEKRIARQIEPDGSQPLELSRTKSLNYSLFNLEALVTLARLGEHVGVDLWKFSTPDGRNLRTALAYVAPYMNPAKQWPKQDIEDADRTRIPPLLAEALRHNSDAGWSELLTKYSGPPVRGEHWRLTSSDAR